MDYLLYALSAILILTGIAGCILPILPGPLLGFAGLFLLYFTSAHPFSVTFIAVYAGLTIVVTLLDYIIPIYGTRRFHGSKYGIWGSTIGLLAGMFFPPFGFIVGPLLGAYLGELLAGRGWKVALRSATGSFIGFLTGTGIKLILTLSMGYYYIKSII